MLIQRLAIQNQGLELELAPGHAAQLHISVRESEKGSPVRDWTQPPAGKLLIDRLFNGVLYEIQVEALDEAGQVLEAGSRLAMPNFVPGKCVSYLHPTDTAFDPAGRFFGSPSLLKVSDGTLYASHDLFLEDYPNQFGVDFRNIPARDRCRTKLYRSEDAGRSWNYVTDIPNCSFGELFEFRGALYIMAQGADADEAVSDPFNVEEHRDSTVKGKGTTRIQLYRSDNRGQTWQGPCVITHGFAGGFHKAPTPVVEHEGRIWTAFDAPKNPQTGYGMAAASAPADSDLMDSRNWTVTSPFLYYDPAWPHALKRFWPYMMEEANLVIAPDQSVRVIARYNSVNYSDEFIRLEDDALRVFMMRADKENPGAPLEFMDMPHFIGSLSKFTIRFDPESGRYYSLVSRDTETHCCQRTILSLVSSADLYHWQVERDLLNLEDMEWYQDCQHCGMHYCSWCFDGEDLVAVCRTALHDCRNFHDANMMTFHRFRNFREKNYAFKYGEN